MDSSATRIKSLRIEAGATQRVVAERVGVRVGTVTAWESGSTPDVPSARKLADYFGVTLDWLLEGIGPKRRKRSA